MKITTGFAPLYETVMQYKPTAQQHNLIKYTSFCNEIMYWLIQNESVLNHGNETCRGKTKTRTNGDMLIGAMDRGAKLNMWPVKGGQIASELTINV